MIRAATPSDVPVVLAMVRELAAYEREPDAVEATEDDLHRALFVEGTCSAHVALDPAGDVVGFALWFPTFSTWRGRPGLWLEDLFVRPAARGRGHGRALLETLAAVCVERGWPRLEWWVLDWNAPAIGFYTGLGAVPQTEWTTFRVDGDALRSLARSDTPAGGASGGGPAH